MSSSDEDIHTAVDMLFDQYDRDEKGTLDIDIAQEIINQTLQQFGLNKKLSVAEVQKQAAAVKKNNDGQITKSMLFAIFKKVLSGK